jgi:hypothetical protein
VYDVSGFMQHVTAGVNCCEYIHEGDCGFHHE